MPPLYAVSKRVFRLRSSSSFSSSYSSTSQTLLHKPKYSSPSTNSYNHEILNPHDQPWTQSKRSNLAETANPFDKLTDDAVFVILDHLHYDPQAKNSFSSTCKTFFFIESLHLRYLKPLRQFRLNSRILRRYPFITHSDLSLQYLDDQALNRLSATYGSNLRSIFLPRCRFLTARALSDFLANCVDLVEIGVTSGTGFNDAMALAIAGAKNLENLWFPYCSEITNAGIGAIAVGCKKLRVLGLKWCFQITDVVWSRLPRIARI